MELTVSLAALAILASVALLVSALEHNQIDIQWENMVFLLLKTSAKNNQPENYVTEIRDTN